MLTEQALPQAGFETASGGEILKGGTGAAPGAQLEQLEPSTIRELSLVSILRLPALDFFAAPRRHPDREDSSLPWQPDLMRKCLVT